MTDEERVLVDIRGDHPAGHWSRVGFCAQCFLLAQLDAVTAERDALRAENARLAKALQSLSNCEDGWCFCVCDTEGHDAECRDVRVILNGDTAKDAQE